MTMFPKTINYEYHSPGAYVNGIWTPGATQSTTFEGSVQALTAKDMQSLPVGRQDVGMVKIYADIELPMSTEGGNDAGAIVLWESKRYEIIQKMDFQNDLIEHYKYIGALRD